MAEPYNMPNKPVTPADSTQKTTEKGPHGGGNKYNQATVGRDFMVQQPITGHKQQKNVDKK